MISLYLVEMILIVYEIKKFFSNSQINLLIIC